MPTTYAHGIYLEKKYIKRLPSDMKARSASDKEICTGFGLLWADILVLTIWFLGESVTQFGIEMHHEKARAFLKKGWQVREEIMM